MLFFKGTRLSRQSTSTPDPVHQRCEASENSTCTSSPPEQHNVDSEDRNTEDDVYSEDYRVSSSNNLNHTNIDINSNGKSKLEENTETFKIPEYSSSKVRAYVESLPSPAQSKSTVNQPDSVEEKRLLDESFDSEASSRSKVSRLSDISNLAGRFSNAGKICFFLEYFANNLLLRYLLWLGPWGTATSLSLPRRLAVPNYSRIY